MLHGAELWYVAHKMGEWWHGSYTAASKVKYVRCSTCWYLISVDISSSAQHAAEQLNNSSSLCIRAITGQPLFHSICSTSVLYRYCSQARGKRLAVQSVHSPPVPQCETICMSITIYMCGKWSIDLESGKSQTLRVEMKISKYPYQGATYITFICLSQ